MKSTVFGYTVDIIPSVDGGYVVTVPALPGCATQGETYEEAIAMTREVIVYFREFLEENGEPVPPPNAIEH